ncbi:MAG TPA: GAF domain-containing protein [Thermoleophilaceae bacterium]|nr:GAF domain-containing protein [Thermoleophilaceae bacterium]
MTVSAARDEGGALGRVRRENETLYAVIKTVSSSLALERVLGGIVEIATDATGCHACFIYFLEDERLVLRAASPRYAHLVGQLAWGTDEGLTGWVARTKSPEFIREKALEDPRMKFVPELEEERFQSMVAVPILGRAGGVIGVVVLHTEAPREFEDEVLNFLVHTASLTAGAIENAQLYEETRRRVEALTTLTQLSQALAAVTLREDLYDAVTRGARQLLGADGCQIWRFDPRADELVLVGSDPAEGANPAVASGRAGLLLDLMRRERGARRSGAAASELDGESLLTAPLAAGEERLGILCCTSGKRRFGDEDAELLRAVADQTAVGLTKAELIERLTAENIVKDMFEALAAGSIETAEAKAVEARCDLSRPHVFIHAERAPAAGDDGPPWPDVAGRMQQRLGRLYPRAFFDARHDTVRALAPLPTGDREAAEGLRRACEELARDEGLSLGLSDVDRGTASARRRIREAADAARIGRSLAGAGGATQYEQLGAYRYLVHLEPGDAPRDRFGQAVDQLIDYDERRKAQLVETLERYLGARCSVAGTARSLFIHPNTVRQRLERIEQVTGLDLREDDLLSLELALKVARLGRVGARR